MKKILAVYCRVELVKEPVWLKSFREKYDEPFDLHITLKQSTYINEDWLSEGKSRLSAIFDNLSVTDHEIKITFDDLVLDKNDPTDGMGWIYIFSKGENKELGDLQIRVRDALKGFYEYVSPESSEYEYDFKPHITIARGLSEDSYDKALAAMGNDHLCEGVIKEIVLSCVEEITPEESHKSSNLTVYRL